MLKSELATPLIKNSMMYVYKIAICLSVCLSVCSCLNVGLTAARISLIFGMHSHIRSDCAIGYMILIFEVIKGHFRSNKFLWQVPLGVLSVGYLLSKKHSARVL